MLRSSGYIFCVVILPLANWAGNAFGNDLRLSVYVSLCRARALIFESLGLEASFLVPTERVVQVSVSRSSGKFQDHVGKKFKRA